MPQTSSFFTSATDFWWVCGSCVSLYFVCLSSSITHESPVYLVNKGDVQHFLSLFGKNSTPM